MTLKSCPMLTGSQACKEEANTSQHTLPAMPKQQKTMMRLHQVEGSLPEMDLEPVREELLVAVGARHLIRQAVLAELILHDAVGGQHHIGLLQLLYACLPLVAMVHNHLQSNRASGRHTAWWQWRGGLHGARQGKAKGVKPGGRRLH